MLRLRPLVLSLCVACMVAPAAEAAPGFSKISLDDAQGDRRVDVDLWYPTEAQGIVATIGGSPVFEGSDGIVDAPIAAGHFPLVLISHGGLRSAPNQANWLGAYLASQGYVAAIANAPQLRPRDAKRAPDETWRRPEDLRAALAHLSQDPAWSPHIDAERIAVVGFFLGGTSGLMLAGARLDPDRYAASCDSEGISVDCAWYAEAGVDLHAVDAAAIAASRAAPQIKALVAFDPELGAVFSPDSLQGIGIPIAVYNLGQNEAVHPALRADTLAGKIPGATYEGLSGAAHFSAFAACTPKGAAILMEDGDDGALCVEPEGGSRPAVHAVLGAKIVETLAAAFRR